MDGDLEEIHRRKMIDLLLFGDGPEFNLLRQYVDIHHLNGIVELG